MAEKRLTSAVKTRFVKHFAKSLSFDDAMRCMVPVTDNLAQRLESWFYSEDSQSEIKKVLAAEALPFTSIPVGLIVRKILEVLQDVEATPRDRVMALRLAVEHTRDITPDVSGAANDFLNASFAGRWKTDV